MTYRDRMEFYADRNRAIVNARRAGTYLRVIAEQWNISRERVWAIVKREEREEAKRGKG